MERAEITILGRRVDGSTIKKILLINDDETNYLVKAQSYFTKEEKKAAKLERKLFLEAEINNIA